MTKNKILIPIDEAEFTLQIVPYIFRYLVPEENDLILLYMAEQRTTEASKQRYNQLGAAHQVQDRFMSEVQPYMRALQQAGFTVSTQVAFGEPKQAIEQWIQQEAVNLIVMATAPQAAVNVPSAAHTAQAVLEQASVPVMHYHTVGLALEQLGATRYH